MVIALPRRRIARSLVTILVLTLIQFTLAPFTSAPVANAASATTGICTLDTVTAVTSSNITDLTGSDGTCMVKILTGSASFQIPAEVNSISALIVGGGGGGGFGNNAGGGGAGSVITTTTGITVPSGSLLSATVGGGGAAGINASDPTNQTYWNRGNTGTASSLSYDTSSFSASGGGYGGGNGTTSGGNGGSGGGSAAGGAAAGAATQTDYAGWTEYANAGFRKATSPGGGGGGAGAAATDSSGAIGVTIFGLNVGGGGNGWYNESAGNATTYGGGVSRGSGSFPCNSCNGVANTGGGGGGGGAGGSGIVVVKFIPARGQGVISTIGSGFVSRSRSFTFTQTNAPSTGVTRTYQWQVKASSGSTWSNVSAGTGGTTTTYSTGIYSTADSGSDYRIAVTDTNATFGISTTTYTSVSGLTVNPMPSAETDTALYFDGTEYAYTNDSSQLAVTSAITLQAWVKPETVTANAWNMVICKEGIYELGFIKDPSTGLTRWHYGLSGTSALYQGETTTVPVVFNEWHHIALTRAAGSSTVLFYMDGKLLYTGTSDSAASGNIRQDNTYQFSIGARKKNDVVTGYFKGQIDQAMVFNTDRSANSIQSDMNSYLPSTTSGLLAFYDFNEGTGSGLINRKSAADASTDLALVNNPTWSEIKYSTISGAYTTTTFERTYLTSLGGWLAPTYVKAVSVLVVGGGGGGGGQYTGYSNDTAGGGGGGGVYEINAYPMTSGTATRIIVGTGGAGGFPASDRRSLGRVGGTTVFESLTAGGGGGATYDPNDVVINGLSGTAGGGGGGASMYWNATTYGAGGQATPLTIGGVTYPGRTGGNAAPYSGLTGGGGGGAGGAASNSTPGAGVTSTITGSVYGRGGMGGGGTAYTFAAKPTSPGNGGDGYASATPNGTYGVTGANGLVVIKYITAAAPVYTKPTTAYLNVGQSETFSVNVASDSATVGFTRTFKWESTTPSANGVYTLIKQGTGAANASFSWVPSDTSTSGTGYLYRLTVTDSDTAGLFITDSSTAFAIINRALVVSGNSTFGKTINVARSETFTITLGTATYRPTLSPVIPGITLDTSTAGVAVVKISETMTVGTYYETLTVVDSVSASVVTPLTIKVIAPPSFTQSSSIAESGLIYHLDPGNSASYARSGNVITDLSGRGRTGSLGFAFGNSSTPYTYKDGTTRNNAMQAGVTCAAPSFSNTPVGNFTYGSGVCSYVPNIESVTTYSYDVWFKSTGSQTGWTPIVTNPYFNTGDQIMFSLDWLSSNTLAAGIFDGTNWWHTTTATIAVGTWVHAAVTFDGTTLSLILNGDLAGKKTGAVTAFSWNASKIVPAIQFAKKWDGAQYFNGAIGSFRLYNRVLSNAEIQQNYLSTSSAYAGNLNVPSKSAKYGSRYSGTYTAFSSADTSNTTLTGSINSLRWDTATALNAAFLYQDSLTVGIYYDTITVTDNLGGSSFLPLTFTVAKADTLTISMDTATVVNFNKSPITNYPKPTYRGLVGSDTLTVTTKFSSATYTLSATVPTNADTYTVIAADPVFGFGAASNYLAIVYETSTAVVNKISQRPLGIFMYGGVVGSPFLISLTGGDGDGVVTETLTGVSSIPGCAIANHYLTSSTSVQGFCEVQVVKAASQNYFSESQTVQLYFMAYLNYQPSGQVGSGTTIAINGSTSLTIDDTNTVRAPNVTSLSVSSGSVGTTIHIYGGNFGAGPLTIKFYRNKIATGTVASGSDITVTVPSGATTGPILVITANGEATTPTFTVLP